MKRVSPRLRGNRSSVVDQVSSRSEKGLQTVAIRKILVPVDFSDRGKPALRQAKYLARISGASVIFLHVTECLYYGVEFMCVPIDIRKLHEDIGKKFESLQHVGFKGIPTSFLIREGEPFEEIVDTAAKTKADLIVMTTHGYTGLKHVFIGSTAERTVRHSACPVWVVHSPALRKNKITKPLFKMAAQ